MHVDVPRCSSGLGTRCVESEHSAVPAERFYGHPGRLTRLAPGPVERIPSAAVSTDSRIAVDPGRWFVHRPGRSIVPQIPESFILLGQVSLIPLAGIVAALVASRIPSLRADT